MIDDLNIKTFTSSYFVVPSHSNWTVQYTVRPEKLTKELPKKLKFKDFLRKEDEEKEE